MKRLWSDKRVFFAGFGALGGLLSAFFYAALELDGPFSSWVIGTGFDGLCIAGLLAFGQARYLGKAFDAKTFGKALLIGGLGGAIGGFIALVGGFPLAQLLGGAEDAGRFLGWMLGGAAVGFAIARVVPNLKARVAVAAGAVGGLAGCALMYLMASIAVAIATTGAAIGLALALAETAFRQTWLEVTIRPTGFSLQKERTVTVSLGEQPIRFGCAPAADVRLAEMAGAGADFAEVALAGGQVILYDQVANTRRNLVVDEAFEISNARVVVRSKRVSGTTS
jgi:hypothetical protein